MNFLNLLFYFIASVVLVSSVLMITVNKTVNAALLLVFIFFNMAIIWLLLGAEFLGIVLVLVYVGAVLVLFLFVVMMLAKQDLVDNSKNKYFISSAIISTIMFVELYLIINTLNDNQFVSDKVIQIDNTLLIGSSLFTNYIIAFEVASVILLVSIIAAIAITYDTKRKVLRQNISNQVGTKKQDRIKIIKDLK